MPSFKLKSSWVTILQGVEFSIFLFIFAWALQQCSANALPVICEEYAAEFGMAFNASESKCIVTVPHHRTKAQDFSSEATFIINGAEIESVNS